MRFLIDSCVVVWWLNDPSSLSKAAREAIENPRNEVYFSAASVWELGLKIQKGKLQMPNEFASTLSSDGFVSLSVTTEHAAYSISLPQFHRDPFDRLLVAQAISEDLILMTRDSTIRHYPVATMEA